LEKSDALWEGPREWYQAEARFEFITAPIEHCRMDEQQPVILFSLGDAEKGQGIG
jgi:hypothetical protein